MSYKPAVAIVGTNGTIGPHLIEAFRSPVYGDKVQLPIIAVTRDASTKQSDSKVKYVTASSTDLVALTNALKGADVVIDLVGASGDHDGISKAAADAGAKVFFPSEFGLDYAASKYSSAFAPKRNAVISATSLGLKVVQVKTNVFLDWAIEKPGLSLLVDIAGGTYTKIGDGEQRISGTSLSDIGKSLAKLSSIPPSELPDVVRITGDTFTVNGLVETYEKVSGKSLKVIPKPLKELTDKADSVLAAGVKDRSVFFHVLYAAIFSGEAVYAGDNDDELVNPGEKDFKWQKLYTEFAKFYSK